MSDFFASETFKILLTLMPVVIVLGLFGWMKFKRDQAIVSKFLKDSGVEPDASRRIGSHYISAVFVRRQHRAETGRNISKEADDAPRSGNK